VANVKNKKKEDQMTGLVTIQNDNQIAHGGMNREQVELIKETICKDATDNELALFLQVCQRTQLDPFARQIYAVKRWDSKANREIMSTQVSIDGMRLAAQRTGQYQGQTQALWCGMDGEWKEVWLSNEPPVAAKIGVYRTGFKEPLCVVARFDSYCQRAKDGKPTKFWRDMPDVMIAKVAEALALRKAFPVELSGLYSSEEMGPASNIEAEIVDAKVASTPTELATLDRLAAIREWTGHTKAQCASICKQLGLRVSTAHQWVDADVAKLRDALFIDWGMGLGVFKALKHAQNAFDQIEIDDDVDLWEAWRANVEGRKAEANAVDVEAF
jgi:phage recombination protein Bet